MTVCEVSGTPKRTCKCRSCLNRRNRRKGARKQGTARRHLEVVGLLPESHATQKPSEEAWPGQVRVEVKAGAQVEPIATRYRNARNQWQEDGRPFVFVAMPQGDSGGLLVIRLDEIGDIIDSAAGNRGWVRKENP